MTPTLTHRSENVKVSELPMLAADQQAAEAVVPSLQKRRRERLESESTRDREQVLAVE
jgi:hypothetical protein